MPINQVAKVDNYEFEARGAYATPVFNGASAVSALQFSVADGGLVQVTIENHGSSAMKVTLAVSDAEAGTFAATSAAANLTAVEDVAIPAGAFRTVELLLRAGVDKFLRLSATGNVNGVMQVRSDIQRLNYTRRNTYAGA